MSEDDKAEPLSGGDDFRTLERHAEETRVKDKRSDVIEAVPPLYMRGTIYLFVAVVIVCLILTYIAKVYVIIPTKGSILPEGQNVVVEAESAGIITDIKISLGDQVKAGQILMELRQDAAGVGLLTLRDQLKIHQSNKVKAEKAIAMVNQVLESPKIVVEKALSNFADAGAAMVYVAALRTGIQKLAQLNERQGIDLVQQKKMMKSQISLQERTIEGLKRSTASSKRTIRTMETALIRKRQTLARTIKLGEDRVLTETQVSQARDQVLAAQSSLSQQRQELSQRSLNITQAQVEIGNQKAQFEKQKREFKNELETTQFNYDKALSDLQSTLATLSQVITTSNATISEAQGKLRLQENTINKLIIKSPVDGEITALNFNTKGQSVGFGTRVVVIVPTDVRPIIMVTIPNRSVAGIREGVSARVKVDAYPFRQFGTVKATVTGVFPLVNKPEFGVRLQLEKNFIMVNDKPVPLEPGLDVEVDLLTERKRILELIFKKMS